MDAMAFRKRPPPADVFFRPLRHVLSPQELESISFAHTCTDYGHFGQFRDDGSPQSDHPKAAAWIYIDELGGRDTRTIIVILLHDHREDTDLLSPFRIELNFGKDIADDVDAQTKREGETRVEFLNRIIARGLVSIISKLSDRLHNMRTLDVCSPKKQQEQVEETLTCDLPMLIPALRSFGDLYDRYATVYQCLIEEALAPYRT